MKRLSVILITAVPALLWSCSGGKVMEEAEGEQAVQQAAQMTDALPDVEQAARNHASRLRPGAYKDSLQLHGLLLDAAATRSRYELAGEKDKAARFDEVFIQELRKENPSLAASLQQ